MLIKVKDHNDSWKLFDNAEDVSYSHCIGVYTNAIDLFRSCESAVVEHNVMDSEVTKVFSNRTWRALSCVAKALDELASNKPDFIVGLADLPYDDPRFAIEEVPDARIAVFVNHIAFVRKGVRKLVFFDTEAYICNDDGKTIERVAAG